MTDNQVFGFLSKFGLPHDVKIIMQNKRIGWWNILRVAWQLKCGVPVAKIIKRKWFYGMSFITTKSTLDPRPDSETLVEAVLKTKPTGSVKILDLGTGTGCLIASIVKNLPNSTGVGIDASGLACKVARKNIRDLGLGDRIKIVKCRFNNCQLLTSGCSIIISNPPYIPAGNTRVNPGAHHDPKSALYGGKDGLKFYRQIAKIRANPTARLFLEIGVGQANAIRKIFLSAGWEFLESYKDLSGRTRVLEFHIPQQV